MGAKIHFTQNQIDSMINSYYIDNLTQSEIAKTWGISHGKLGGLFQQYHVLSKNGGRNYGIHPSQWEEVIGLYLKNKQLSIGKIAMIYNVGRMTVENILKNQNIKIRSNGVYQNNAKPENYSDITQDYKNNIKVTDLRKKYKISEKTLYKILIEQNCPIRASGALSKIILNTSEENAMIENYKSGKSIDLIAEELKYSPPFISQQLKSRGITVERGFTRRITRYQVGSRGICGYYKNQLFRSMNELSFIVNFLEKRNIEYISGESYIFHIPYQFEGKNRKYFPDFITDKYIFEIKPKKFWTGDKTQAKALAAKEYASTKGVKYRMLEYPIIIDPIIEKVKLKQITFTAKGQIKFNKNYGKLL